MTRNRPEVDDCTARLEALGSGPPEVRQRVIRELIADTPNRERILESLLEEIQHQSAAFYDSDGLRKVTASDYEASVGAAVVQQAAIQTLLGIVGPRGLLDDPRYIGLVDKSGMLERLERWPDHIRTMRDRAAEIAGPFRKQLKGRKIRHVTLFGLGGSGAPHDIVVNTIDNFRKSRTRIEVVHADDPNPDHVDEKTLVILSSFSGNTEETIHCYDVVRKNTDLFVALTKGGQLLDLARRDGFPCIQLPAEKSEPAYVMQPRESVCLQMTAMLTFLGHIGLEPGSKGEFTFDDLAIEEKAIPLIKELREKFEPKVPFKDNDAKQLAFFLLYGIHCIGGPDLPEYDLWRKKVPCILVDRNNWGIGHEVRTQLHERSKVNAIFYDAPEFLHNLVESIRTGVESCRAGLDESPFVYYFVRSPQEEPRIRLRLDKTLSYVIEKRWPYAVLNTQERNPYHSALCAAYFNAHMTIYLAILNGVDPLPVPTMDLMKNVMRGLDRDGTAQEEAVKRGRPMVRIEPARTPST